MMNAVIVNMNVNLCRAMMNAIGVIALDTGLEIALMTAMVVVVVVVVVAAASADQVDEAFLLPAGGEGIYIFIWGFLFLIIGPCK